MKASNTLSPRRESGVQGGGFSAFINSPAVRAMIEKSVSNPKTAASLVSTLISVVSANEKLKECDGNTIIAAALRGEVGMGLSLALGQYAIVPYGNQAAFQLGDKGLRQLAIRSGQYEDIDCFDVREGEYLGRDPRTRRPLFSWIEDEEEREKRPIAGYYAYYQLNQSNNGFFKGLYWSHEKILSHAGRYSKAFELEKYRALLAGELEESEAKKLRGGSPWYDLPDSVPHQKMCIKTLMKQLLSDGFAPLEVQRAIEADDLEEKSGNPMIYSGAVPEIPAKDSRQGVEAAFFGKSESAKAEPAPNPEADKAGEQEPLKREGGR